MDRRRALSWAGVVAVVGSSAALAAEALIGTQPSSTHQPGTGVVLPWKAPVAASPLLPPAPVSLGTSAPAVVEALAVPHDTGPDPEPARAGRSNPDKAHSSDAPIPSRSFAAYEGPHRDRTRDGRRQDGRHDGDKEPGSKNRGSRHDGDKDRGSEDRGGRHDRGGKGGDG